MSVSTDSYTQGLFPDGSNWTGGAGDNFSQDDEFDTDSSGLDSGYASANEEEDFETANAAFKAEFNSTINKLPLQFKKMFKDLLASMGPNLKDSMRLSQGSTQSGNTSKFLASNDYSQWMGMLDSDPSNANSSFNVNEKTVHTRHAENGQTHDESSQSSHKETLKTSSKSGGIEKNSGGVPQAKASSGIHPESVTIVSTGSGSDKYFNITNNTRRTESFTYSVRGVNKGTMTLEPGQTGTFMAAKSDVGVRISPSDAQGNTRPNEVLYEDGTNNPDISKVDGDKDDEGHDENMTVTLSDGRMAGDSDSIRPYLHSTDDAAAMQLAGDPSNTANIVLSDG